MLVFTKKKTGISLVFIRRYILRYKGKINICWLFFPSSVYCSLSTFYWFVIKTNQVWQSNQIKWCLIGRRFWWFGGAASRQAKQGLHLFGRKSQSSYCCFDGRTSPDIKIISSFNQFPVIVCSVLSFAQFEKQCLSDYDWYILIIYGYLIFVSAAIISLLPCSKTQFKDKVEGGDVLKLLLYVGLYGCWWCWLALECSNGRDQSAIQLWEKAANGCLTPACVTPFTKRSLHHTVYKKRQFWEHRQSLDFCKTYGGTFCLVSGRGQVRVWRGEPAKSSKKASWRWQWVHNHRLWSNIHF